jgi:hypothetical protein
MGGDLRIDKCHVGGRADGPRGSDDEERAHKDDGAQASQAEAGGWP